MGEVCICGTLAQGAAGVFLRATLGWFGGSGGGVFLESDLVRWEGLDFGTGFKPLSHMLLDLLFAVWQGERVVSLLCLVCVLWFLFCGESANRWSLSLPSEFVCLTVVVHLSPDSPAFVFLCPTAKLREIKIVNSNCGV